MLYEIGGFRNCVVVGDVGCACKTVDDVSEKLSASSFSVFAV
jgi:hypothetical protein